VIENVLDVLKFLQNHEVDVIYLDIYIPTLDGFTLAKTIYQYKHKPKILLTTAYKECALTVLNLKFLIIFSSHSQKIESLPL